MRARLSPAGRLALPDRAKDCPRLETAPPEKDRPHLGRKRSVPFFPWRPLLSVATTMKSAGATLLRRAEREVRSRRKEVRSEKNEGGRTRSRLDLRRDAHPLQAPSRRRDCPGSNSSASAPSSKARSLAVPRLRTTANIGCGTRPNATRRRSTRCGIGKRRGESVDSSEPSSDLPRLPPPTLSCNRSRFAALQAAKDSETYRSEHLSH